MSFIDSLERFKTVKIGRKRTVAIRKFNLIQRLEFIIHYDYWVLLKEGAQKRKEETELLKMSALKRPLLIGKKSRRKIILETKKYNFANDPKLESKAKNPYWLQSLIVYFAKHLAYSKQEVFSLFPEELEPLMNEIRKQNNQDSITRIAERHNPKYVLDTIKREGEISSFPSAKMDRFKVEALKQFQNGRRN